MANIKGNASNNNLVGTIGNDVIDGLGGADTMSGGLGNDVYIVDNIGDIVIEAFNAGIDTVQASINYLLTANVENLQLTGTTNINGTGNALNNSLTGNSGNNILDGGLGADTMSGGAGNDTYMVDNVGDIVTESINQGTDSVQASVNYTLAANIENLTLIGIAALNGTGNALNNIITGNSGNNILDGGAGADTLIGGIGNDIYIVDNAGDVVIESVAAGIDTVQTTTSYVLGLNLENLTLTGAANINGMGNALDNIITGNGGSNTLNGGLGNDTLNGGAGIDSMVGGVGNDTYIVDNAGDLINELVGEGTDTAQASVSYTLGATNIENLVLTGTANINGTGNALDNNLTGNSGNNVLNGGAGNDTIDGGAGADTMIGGAGNDTFIVDNTYGDLVTELVGAGIDTVQSSVNYQLGANIENLILTSIFDFNGVGTGNALNNTITGSDGNNYLDGAAGADTLIGGLGDDTYVIDDVGDVVIEAAGAGTDYVIADISYTLGANIENLYLNGIGIINGTGNALDNIIYGNDADNILDGALGIDTLYGGYGNDTYIVDINDVIVEYAGQGIDNVHAKIDYTLGNTEIENLTLIGAATIGTGNALDNTITGNALDNILDGAGGNDILDGAGGSDILLGGLGDDTYIVNDTSVLIIESVGEGTDTVVSSIDYLLGADIENLALAGTAAVNGTGNQLGNIITGNSGDNILEGGLGVDTLHGGSGNDTLFLGVLSTSSQVSPLLDETTYSADVLHGGLGDDTYYLSNDVGLNYNTISTSFYFGSQQVVVNYIFDTSGLELQNQGTDTVIANFSIFLDNPIFQNIENVTLQGSENIDAFGDGGNNLLIGNEGNNSLGSSSGNDTLEGGIGDDIFLLNSGSGQVATINDFGNGVDRLSLNFINNSSSGVLDSTQFVSGLNITSGDGSKQVIYNTITGDLYYEDGLNPDAPIHFATLIGVPTLSGSDFIVGISGLA